MNDGELGAIGKIYKQNLASLIYEFYKKDF